MKADVFTSVPWYYRIEVENGVFTNGREHQNLALTRKLLRAVQVEGIDCIDIGTQEAVIPILLKKAGAGHVVAYDRFDLSRKIEALKGLYNVDFLYACGFELDRLPAQLQRLGERRTYDLVVFSGVLYHMINPLGLLALVRGLNRAGGLFLIESVAIQDARELLLFNAGGAAYGASSNYFVPTTAWLDYVLRMLGLEPLAAIYAGEMQEGRPIRLAILCRSRDRPCPADSGDAWVFQDFHKQIFEAEAQMSWGDIASNRGPLGYASFDESVCQLSGQCLYRGLQAHPAYLPQQHERNLTLDASM